MIFNNKRPHFYVKKYWFHFNPFLLVKTEYHWKVQSGQEVLWEDQHISYWYSGQSDRDPDISFVVPEGLLWFF